MASVYTGNTSPYAKPAAIETNPIIDTSGNLISVMSFPIGSRLTFDISNDGGLSFTQYQWRFLAPNTVFNTIAGFVDFMNTNFNANGNLEWYIPGYSDIVNGTLVRQIYGFRVGVRLKLSKGQASILKLSTNPGTNSALGIGRFNVPAGTYARGDSGFTEILPGPSPFDPFRALTVQLYEKGLIDRDMSTFISLKKYTYTANTLVADSTDGATIKVSGLVGTVQVVNNKPVFYNQTAVTLSAANLGGAFQADTWYYVYNYINNGAVSYEISATPPSPANPIFKTGDSTRRYMFDFLTNGASTIIPFNRKGNRHTYLTPQPILLGGTSSNVAATINTNRISPISRMAELKTKFVVNSGALSYYFLFPGGRGNQPGQLPVYTSVCNTNGGKEDSLTFPIIPTTIDYQVLNSQDTLDIYVTGFIE